MAPNRKHEKLLLEKDPIDTFFIKIDDIMYWCHSYALDGITLKFKYVMSDPTELRSLTLMKFYYNQYKIALFQQHAKQRVYNYAFLT